MTALLQATGLTRFFGGLTAVKNVSFSVSEGEVRALIGPNGAGKSTLVGLLCGRIEASAGTVSFAGQDVTHLPAHARIRLGMAYTFQITSIFSRLSLYENVALAARPTVAKDAVDGTVRATLERVGLHERVDELAGNLSYGHQRILEIAMGLAQSPRLLILDEPTQGLAEAEVAAFKALIRELAGNTTILLIEHNMDVVMDVAERITVLNFGEVLAEGTPDEIRSDHAVQAAYLGHD